MLSKIGCIQGLIFSAISPGRYPRSFSHREHGPAGHHAGVAGIFHDLVQPRRQRRRVFPVRPFRRGLQGDGRIHQQFEGEPLLFVFRQDPWTSLVAVPGQVHDRPGKRRSGARGWSWFRHSGHEAFLISDSEAFTAGRPVSPRPREHEHLHRHSMIRASPKDWDVRDPIVS